MGSTHTRMWSPTHLRAQTRLAYSRVRAREMYTGSWNYEFEFEPTCIVQEAKDMMFGRGFGRLTRWLRGGKSAGDHLLGPRYSGSNDISDKDARCRCLNYDAELRDYFVGRGFTPSAGIAASGASTFSEDAAGQMLNDLRRELRRLRRTECPTDDCPKDEDAYPWDKLLELARQRGIPQPGRIFR